MCQVLEWDSLGNCPVFLYFGAFLGSVSGFWVGFFRKPALLLHFGSLFKDFACRFLRNSNSNKGNTFSLNEIVEIAEK